MRANTTTAKGYDLDREWWLASSFAPLKKDVKRSGKVFGARPKVVTDNFYFAVNKRDGFISLDQTLEAQSRPIVRDERYRPLRAELSGTSWDGSFWLMFALDAAVNGAITRQEGVHLPSTWEGGEPFDKIVLSIGTASIGGAVARPGEFVDSGGSNLRPLPIGHAKAISELRLPQY